MRAILPLAWLLVSVFVPALAPMTGAQPVAAPAWEIPDAAGDQYVNASLFTTAAVPLPANAAMAAADLRRASIDWEDDAGLNITFQVQALKVQLNPSVTMGFNAQCGGSSSSGGGNTFSPTGSVNTYSLMFDLAGSPYRYQVTARVYGENQDAAGASVFTAQAATGYLCVQSTTPGSIYGNVIFQPIDVTLDRSQPQIHVHVAKAALMTRLGTPTGNFLGSRTPFPVKLTSGDHLTHLFAQTTDGNVNSIGFTIGGTGSIQDIAPNTGYAPDYVLRNDTANTNIELTLPHSGPDWPVATGINQTVQVTLKNTMPEKRIIALRYALSGPSHTKYTIAGPASIGLAAGDSRRFNVAVNVTPGTKPDEVATLVVRGMSAGYPGETAYDAVLLRPTPVLEPGNNVVYVHFRSTSTTTPSTSTVTCQAPVFSANCQDPFLSMQQDDPRAGNPDRGMVVMTPTAAGAWRGFIRDPISTNGNPLPAALDPAKPVQILLKLKTTTDMAGVQVHGTLSFSNSTEPYDQTTPLADGTSTVTISSGGTVATISAPSVLGGEHLLPAGSLLHLRLDFTIPTGPGVPASQAQIEIDGRDSQIQFPLLELSPEMRAGASASPFQLTALGSRDDFVNPGKARLFNASLLNQGDAKHLAHLTLEVQPSTWRAEVHPGTEYSLNPGDALRLAVLLFAPAGAKEGEKGVAFLNATEPGQAPATLRLAALATTGLDLPDDSTSYKVDEDAQAHLATETPKKSPDVSLALVALGVLAAAWSRRRGV